MSEDSALSNGIDSTTARRFAGEILTSWKRSRELREDAKEKIRPDLEHEVERRTGLYEAAESAGLPLNALKLEVARQKLDWENELRKKAKEAKAGDDIVEIADFIKEALGDFADSPLGSAAVSAAKASKAGKTAKSEKAPKEKAAAGKARKAKVPLVGEDTGAAPKAGADDESDLRGARQREKDATRKAEAEERLAGMKKIDDGVPVH
jgi:hypothetical protein